MQNKLWDYMVGWKDYSSKIQGFFMNYFVYYIY
jgi:hypothetical protein